MDDTPHPLKGIRAGYAAGLIAADVDTPGNLSCSTGIIRPKASVEGGNLTPSLPMRIPKARGPCAQHRPYMVEVHDASPISCSGGGKEKHSSRVSPSHGSVPAGYGDRQSLGAATLTGLRVKVPP